MVAIAEPLAEPAAAPGLPPAPAGDLLTLRAVSKRFQTSRHDTVAVQDISFSVREGEFVCIVGPSGCGKSTLLNLIAGLDKPTDGELWFDGHRVTGPAAERVVVFQEPALLPWLNVRQNVEFGLKIKGTPARERRDIAGRYLELVNLTRFERAFVHELSGGMKQRAQLARALAVEPRMLLMDEPFAALDAQTRDVLQFELQEIWARTGATIVFITHNVREAALLADRVLVMTPGPGRIKDEIPVALQRPRNPDTHAVVDFAAAIRQTLQHEEARGIRPGEAYAMRALNVLVVLGFYAALIGVWQLLYDAEVWSRFLFPSPGEVWDALVDSTDNGVLFRAVTTTLRRLAVGFAIAFVIGMAIGVATGTVRRVDQTLGSLVLGLQSLPSITWLPLALIWFGLNDKAIVFVVVMGSVNAIAISARDGVRNIPVLQRRAAQVFGASRLQTIRYVTLPGMLPAMAQGLKLGWSFSWRSLMAGELLFVSAGIGSLFDLGRSLGDISLVMAMMGVVIAIGLAFDRLVFAPLENWVRTRWGLSAA